MSDKSPIYLDFSTLSTFRACQEKARLRYVEHWTPRRKRDYFDFGSAFHAGNEAISVNPNDSTAIMEAMVSAAPSLTVAMEDSRRSLERGAYLLGAYREKYKYDIYTTIHNPLTGKPYTELSFAIYLMEWNGHPVFYVGKIDEVKMSREDGKAYVFEKKTTTQALSIFLKSARLNHQNTGYLEGARLTLPFEVAGVVWDCTYVSDRQPNPKKGGWLEYGVDIEKDFARTITYRSNEDVAEFYFTTRLNATQYLDMRDRTDLPFWSQNMPSACSMYGGCEYADVCRTHRNPQVLNTFFEQIEWKPYDATQKSTLERALESQEKANG